MAERNKYYICTSKILRVPPAKSQVLKALPNKNKRSEL